MTMEEMKTEVIPGVVGHLAVLPGPETFVSTVTEPLGEEC